MFSYFSFIYVEHTLTHTQTLLFLWIPRTTLLLLVGEVTCFYEIIKKVLTKLNLVTAEGKSTLFASPSRRLVRWLDLGIRRGQSKSLSSGLVTGFAGMGKVDG